MHVLERAWRKVLDVIGSRGAAVLERPEAPDDSDDTEIEVFEASARARDEIVAVQRGLRLGTAQVAKKLAVTQQTVRDWIRRGVIAAELRAGDYYITGSTLYDLQKVAERVRADQPNARLLPALEATIDAEVTSSAIRRSPQLMRALRASVKASREPFSIGRPEHEADARRVLAESDTAIRSELIAESGQQKASTG